MKDIKEVQRFLIHLLHHIEGPYPRRSQQDIRDPYLLIIEQKNLRDCTSLWMDPKDDDLVIDTRWHGTDT